MTIAGVDSWFEITGDRLVAFRRGSRQGGSLVFLINVEDRIAKTTVKPRWGITTGHDLLNDQALTLADVFDDAAGKPLAAPTASSTPVSGCCRSCCMDEHTYPLVYKDIDLTFALAATRLLCHI